MIIFVIVAVSSGIFGIWLFEYFEESEQKACERSFEYVNDNVACGTIQPIISKKGYASLRNRLEDYIAVRKKEGVLSDAAVYYRDLRAGPVFGINETAPYAPASLLKLPLALLYLAKEDENPGFLRKQPMLKYTLPSEEGRNVPGRPLSSLNLGQAFPPPDEILPGKPYQIEDLLRRLLAYSDNRANDLLAEHVLQGLGGEQEFVQVYRDLGMIDSESLGDETITVRSYSSIFRLLYNANYVSAELSEKALSWLAESSFTEGLVAGVPKGLSVSHKFGERELSTQKIQQLHDCGIVFFPSNPYLLCIMTKGKDVHQLAGVIADISRFVYEEVDSRRINR